MKTITRNHAIEMFHMLGTMALGHMDEETLTATLDNFDKLRKVQEDYQKLAEELSKRLYEGQDEDKKKEFFEIVGKYEGEKDADKKAEYDNAMKAYAEFYPLYKKQIAVLTKMYFKEIEVDFTEVDKDAFVKGVVLGKKDIHIVQLDAFFAPMFKEEAEKKETDMSELDEFMKD